MKFLLSVLLILSTTALARPLVVVVVDTGLTKTSPIPLCKTGHKDLTGAGLLDQHGHGSNISYIIDRFADTKDYCQIIVKFYPSKDSKQVAVDAFKYILTLKHVDLVNFSAGGIGRAGDEYRAIRAVVDKGAYIIVAAGNNDLDLDQNCVYFPACYTNKKIIVIGNGKSKDKPNYKSNYGSIVNFWEDGDRITAGGTTMSGTSQAAAIFTGKLINYITSKRKTNSIMENRTLEALYKQVEMDVMVDRLAKRYIKKLPDPVIRTCERLYPITKVLIKQRIEFKWSFE